MYWVRRVDVNPGCVEVGRFRFSHFINDLDFCSVSSHLFCVWMKSGSVITLTQWFSDPQYRRLRCDGTMNLVREGIFSLFKFSSSSHLSLSLLSLSLSVFSSTLFPLSSVCILSFLCWEAFYSIEGQTNNRSIELCWIKPQTSSVATHCSPLILLPHINSDFFCVST